MNTVNFKTYKAVREHYNGCDDIEIKLPEGIRLVFKDGVSGHANRLHMGHNHYMAFMRKSDWPEEIATEIARKNHWMTVDDFDDLILLGIDHIKPVDPLPIYTSEEMMIEFGLSNYYIVVNRKKRFDEDKFNSIKDTVSGALDEENIARIQKECEECFVPGKLSQIIKINNIDGPYSVTAFRVVNYDIAQDKPYLFMGLERDMSLRSMISDSGSSYEDRKVVKDADALFFEAEENVLKFIGI